MLGELRRRLDLTQAIVADRLDVTQENVSQIERGEADVRLSTLNRYIEALGGRLEIRAAFPQETVALSVSKTATVRRRRTRPTSTKTPRNRKTTRAGRQPQQATPDSPLRPFCGHRNPRTSANPGEQASLKPSVFGGFRPCSLAFADVQKIGEIGSNKRTSQR
jgi:transcriptional regulator with XRE-family HTH domain